jgi:hypothetical protein
MDNSKTSRSAMNSTRLEREEPAVAFHSRLDRFSTSWWEPVFTTCRLGFFPELYTTGNFRSQNSKWSVFLTTETCVPSSFFLVPFIGTVESLARWKVQRWSMHVTFRTVIYTCRNESANCFWAPVTGMHAAVADVQKRAARGRLWWSDTCVLRALDQALVLPDGATTSPNPASGELLHILPNLHVEIPSMRQPARPTPIISAPLFLVTKLRKSIYEPNIEKQWKKHAILQ